MTDIIKDHVQVASGKVVSYVRKNKEFEEIKDLKVDNPTIIAFGFFPNLCLSSMAFSNNSGLIFHESSSESIKTGIAPW